MKGPEIIWKRIEGHMGEEVNFSCECLWGSWNNGMSGSQESSEQIKGMETACAELDS